MSSLTLIILTLIAAWVAWRYYLLPAQKRAVRRQPRRPAPRPAASPRRIEATTLEPDPKTGVYRPVDRGE